MSGEFFFPAAGVVQVQIVLGQPEVNIQHAAELIAANPPPAGSLLVLPEMWATGFDYEHTDALAEQTPSILVAMQALAGKYHGYIAGSLAEPVAGEAPRNTLYVVGEEGVLGEMSKQHLFRHWMEDRFYQAGDGCSPVQTPHGMVGGLVCYDLRFPELARRQAFAGTRVLIVSAEWPLTRLDHWQTLLRARAIENQAYVIAANGCGYAGSLELAGHSMIIAPDGSMLAVAGQEPGSMTVPLSAERVEEERARFCPPGENPWKFRDVEKVCNLETLLAKLEPLRRQKSRIAFTNGCFDILHAGHVSYLEQARRSADCLIVGLNADVSVQALKGPHRPVNREQDRARVLAALGCVDYVVVFEEETPLTLIRAIKPEVLVKGADWPESQIIGAAEVKAAGGRVERIVFEHDRSTTAVIEKIQAIENYLL